MSLCSSAPREAAAVVVRPTRVRVQSTLLPNEKQRLECYNKHEVRDGDSIQKLAIKYRVSVAAIKAANKMIADDVIGFQELWIPKQRNGPSQELSRMITVLPSVSWQSFLRQISAAHGLSQGSVVVQCLSKVTVDTYGHAKWITLASTDELVEELNNTLDANASKDFLRVRVQERQAGEGGEGEGDPLADKLTYDTTLKRNASTVVKDAEDAEAEGRYVEEAKDEHHKRPLPRIVVRSPHPSRALQAEDKCSIRKLCSCLYYWAPAAAPERNRENFIKKNVADEAEAASLLKNEQADS